MSEEARPYRTVSIQTWRRMLALGHQWDVEKGGLYDSRAGVVNLWVSPEDHPSPSWDGVETTQGALAYPRSYLGAIDGDYDLKDTVTLTLEVTPYDRKKDRRPGLYPPPTEDEWTWLRVKADLLVDAAERLLEPPGADAGLYCKFCDRPIPCVLMNDFIHHLQGAHGVAVTALVLGDPSVLHTNVGPIQI